MLGLGRYSGDDLEWFRIFTLVAAAQARLAPVRLSYDGRREPDGVSGTCSTPATW